MNKIESVNIIIPCRNEEKYIGKSLDSIVSNDYPKDKLEVLVIDGRSTDKTKAICNDYSNKYPFIRLLDNPEKMQTFATNIGLKAVTGDVILRMDAHAEYPRYYISKLIYWLNKSSADCVGGICVTKPGADTLVAKACAISLSHPFGVGNAFFRIGLEKPKYVDTVPFGCYRRDVFKRVGLFNENLDRTDDLEFNLRLKRSGGKILLVPEIESYYYARPDLLSLARQNFGNGFWIIYSLKFVKLPFSIRHLVPLFFVSSLLSTIILSLFYLPFLYLFYLIIVAYLTANMFFAFKLSQKNGFKYLHLLVLSFFTLHFSYGAGSLCAIGKLCRERISRIHFGERASVRGNIK